VNSYWYKICADDIIFRSTNVDLVEKFFLMNSEFEISMMGELISFLGPQIKQIKDDIFICQIKYGRELIKKFELDNYRTSKALMLTNSNLDVDEWLIIIK
jgi:Reverse transcriptase (RNA-dependent DNA polymerase)